MSLPKIVKGDALKNYFLEHVKLTSKSGFYKVVKPLYVFKKTGAAILSRYYNTGVVTNLIIPVGAIVYAPDCVWEAPQWNSALRKMRASKAIVHSQALCHGKRRQVDNSRSDYCNSFIYKNGAVVKPWSKFSYESYQCASGIHFFLNLADAYRY